jgi:drug/metabolite transporter (DMT)-like permease
MKRGMHSMSGETIFSSEQVGALRMVIAGLILLPFGIYNLKKITSFKFFFSILGVGLFGNFFPAFLFTYAEQGLSSGYTGMLNSFTPVFTIILGAIFFKSRLTSIQFSGLFISILGVALLIKTGGDSIDNNSVSFKYTVAVVLATLCYAISLNLIKHMLSSLKAIETTSLAFTFTLLPALIIGWNSNVIDTIKTNDFALEGLFFIGILALFGTALAVILFNKLTINTTTLFASSVTYLIPIVAVLIGVGFGEQISFSQVISMAVVLIGIFVANRKKRIRAV